MSATASKRRGSGRLEPIKDEIVRLYGGGWTLQEIGDRFGCTGERVRQILRELGIPRQRLTRTETGRVLRAVVTAARLEERARRGLPHGTRCCYGYYRCRCEECTRANRENIRALKGKTPPTHGVSGYSNYGCRCDTCKAAWSDKQWRERPFGFRKATA